MLVASVQRPQEWPGRWPESMATGGGCMKRWRPEPVASAAAWSTGHSGYRSKWPCRPDHAAVAWICGQGGGHTKCSNGGGQSGHGGGLIMQLWAAARSCGGGQNLRPGRWPYQVWRGRRPDQAATVAARPSGHSGGQTKRPQRRPGRGGNQGVPGAGDQKVPQNGHVTSWGYHGVGHWSDQRISSGCPLRGIHVSRGGQPEDIFWISNFSVGDALNQFLGELKGRRCASEVKFEKLCCVLLGSRPDIHEWLGT